VFFPVAEIEDEPYQQPDDQPHPGRPPEPKNHGAANNDPKRADYRRRRDAEGSFQLRAAHPQDPNSHADQNESEERPNTRHVADDFFGKKRSEQSGEDKKKHIRFIRSPETRMHVGEDPGDQSIATHGIKDARLPEQHHEYDG